MWLKRQTEGASNRDYMQDFELRLAGVDERCLKIVTKAFQVVTHVSCNIPSLHYMLQFSGR